jgi:TetR/AcrR family transcriptional regulator, regulator of autoinduction and epiphytic fitness
VEAYTTHVAGPVKAGRPRGTRRRTQIEATKGVILEAAARLFADRGYVGTSMETLAEEAGVVVQTIYNAFGSKFGVLTRLFDITIAGDERDVPLAERIGKDIHDEQDPRRIVDLLAAHLTSVHRRMHIVNRIIWTAVAVDPEIDAYWRTNRDLRMWGYTQAAKELHAKGGLRRGLSTETAAAVIWSLGNPETFDYLTQQRSWSDARYRRWVGDAMAGALLN